MIQPKTILTALIVVTVSLLFTDCLKKGKDDPVISFRTRKARMTGEWKMTKGSVENFDGYSTITGEYTKDSYVVTEKAGQTVFQTSGSGIEFTIKFSKDGSLDYTRSLFPYTSSSVVNGSWNFLGDMGSYKNKERVIFFRTKTSTNSNLVYDIVELRNKKLVLKKIDQFGDSKYSEEFTFEQD